MNWPKMREIRLKSAGASGGGARVPERADTRRGRGMRLRDGARRLGIRRIYIEFIGFEERKGDGCTLGGDCGMYPRGSSWSGTNDIAHVWQMLSLSRGQITSWPCQRSDLALRPGMELIPGEPELREVWAKFRPRLLNWRKTRLLLSGRGRCSGLSTKGT